MSEFISAVQASKLTPVSASTIKRFIRDVVDDTNHASRDKIQPSVNELRRTQEAGEPYRWTIEKEFAIEQFGAADEKKGSGESEPSGMVLEILRSQLEAKDAQIRTFETQLDRKDDQIKRQDDRMQETHILMQDLQKRLSLTAPAPEAITVDEIKNEKPAGKSSVNKDSNQKTKKSTTTKKEKQRGLFGGLFRRAK
ncbi:MAG: hypothetical protein WBD20_27440 [Pirellulaceae bacterium]